MSVLVTGAGGFLGSAIVKAVAASGRSVLAMHRPASRAVAADGAERITPLAGDLRQPGPWVEAITGVTEVIHCAAAASGDLATQLAGTVLATENLLAALPPSLQRFVHISSFSVYDFGAPGAFGTLDERTPLEARPLRRDAYTQTKLAQEAMVREHCRARGIPLVVIRPGAIYGPGKDWDYGAAMRTRRFDLIFAPLARMRLIHVDDCAAAAVRALAVPIEGELVVNIVGSEQPSHWAFHRAARKGGAPVGTAIPIPYALVRLAGAAAWLASRLLFNGKARLPELLDLPRQAARWRNLRYRNDVAVESLGWRENRTIAGALPDLID